MTRTTLSNTRYIRTRPTILAVFISATLSLAALPSTAQETSVPPATKESRNYNIPTQSLRSALIQFEQLSGLQVKNSELAEDKQALPVIGVMSDAQALERLLAGTAIHYQIDGKTIHLSANAQTTNPLPTVKVAANAINEGSPDAGYVNTKITAVGPWRGRDIQDTPYSVNVVSKELIENLQSTTTDQVFKVIPTVQRTWPQAQNDYPAVHMRGFEATSFARDGISRQGRNFHNGTTMEEIERVETLTGLSGFIYGAGSVGGSINFITKRPTEERLNSVTVGNTGGENFYAHGDFGGQFDEAGQFGYRINAVTQDGENQVDHQNIERQFISGAFDWQVTSDVIIAINASKRDYDLTGRQPYWYMAAGAERPSADDIDVTKIWGQKWSYLDVESERLGANIDWSLAENLSLRAGYLDEYNEQTYALPWNYVQTNGTYNQWNLVREDAPLKVDGEGAFLFGDYAFSVGNTHHKMTVGLQQSESVWRNYPDPEVYIIYNGLSMDEPTYTEKPEFAAHGTRPPYPQHDQQTRTLSLGDDIVFNDYWSALIGVAESQIKYKNFNATGARIANYDESEITPTASVIYKPVESVSTYVSYMESLEQGGVARTIYATLPVINANEVMAPLVANQIELGAKTTIGRIFWTAALFEIDKPFEYYEVLNGTSAQYVQDGRQVHRGLEVTATGRITDNLTAVGGFTWLDAEVKENKQTPQMEGKSPINVAENMAKLYLEYTLPNISALSFNGGINYSDNRYGDNLNKDSLDSYVVADIGARYLIDVGNNDLTLRLNINNVTDENYWANETYLGDPRTVVLSVNLSF